MTRAALLFALSTLVTGCGAGETTMSGGTYGQRASAICREARATNPDRLEGDTKVELAAIDAQINDHDRRAIAELKRLTPPRALRQTADEWLREVERNMELNWLLLDATREGWDGTDPEALFAELKAVGARVNRLAIKLGARGCVAPTSYTSYR